VCVYLYSPPPLSLGVVLERYINDVEAFAILASQSTDPVKGAAFGVVMVLLES